jgi:putative transposase
MEERSAATTRGKKTKGRKRHLIVDVLGHLLGVRVTSAAKHDAPVGGPLIRQTALEYPTLQAFLGDGTYGGICRRYVANKLGLALHISRKVVDGFAVLPKRWIVERGFAWLGNCRRLSKDYERLVVVAENFIRIAMMRLVLRQIARF